MRIHSLPWFSTIVCFRFITRAKIRGDKTRAAAAGVQFMGRFYWSFHGTVSSMAFAILHELTVTGPFG